MSYARACASLTRSGWAVTVLCTLFLLLVTPHSAQADDGISLSRDGLTWGAALPDSLFDDAYRWVPGDVQESQFFVRNDSSDQAALQIRFSSGEIDELISEGDLIVSTRIDAGEWTSTSMAGVQQLSSWDIAAGAVRQVDVRVALPYTSPNATQNLALEFDLLVTLSAEPPPDPDNHNVSPDTLPATGGVVANPLLWVLMIGIGVASVWIAAIRRRRATESSSSRLRES